MKMKKMLAVLSAMTMMFTANAGVLPELVSTKAASANAEGFDIAPDIADLPEIVPETSAISYTENEDGWVYAVANDAVIIGGYKGGLTELTIPDTIDGLPVLTISDNAFEKNTDLKSLDLGKVRNLGYNALKGCTALKEITIPATVEYVNSLSNNVGFLEGSYVETVTFEDGTTTIAGSVCQGAAYLKKVVIPDSVENISPSAFKECSMLETVDIPENTKYIGTRAFEKCTSLSSFDLKSINELGYEVFKDCTSLKELTIPATLEKTNNLSNTYGIIGRNAVEKVIFAEGTTSIKPSLCQDMTALRTVVIPDSVESVAYKAFSGCTNLESVDISENTTFIGVRAFENCTSLTSLDLKNVKELGYEIIKGCKFKEITIPNTLEKVETLSNSYGVLGNSGVETVTFAEGTTGILGAMCKDMTSLTSVNIPESVANIYVKAFSGCSKLPSVDISPNTEYIGVRAFEGCSSLTEFDLSNVKTVAYEVFKDCINLKEMTIPASLVTVDNLSYNYGFLGGSFVEKVVFEEGIPNIPACVCKDASKLTEIVMPEKADVIDGYAIAPHAFENTALTEVNFPESLTSIGAQAFSDCASLTDVKLTDNITYVGNQAFKGCKRLVSIDLNKVQKTGYELFRDAISLKEITIPNTLVDVESSYSKYGVLGGSSVENVVFADGIPNIPTCICKDASQLKDVVMPEKEDTIDGYAIQSHAFENTPLTKINFPESLTAINGQAFMGCANLTDIKLPDNVTYVGTQAFSDCKRLVSIDLSNTQKIGYEVFSGAVSLKEITIPNTLVDVESSYGKYGVLGGSSVEKVVFADGIPNIPTCICKDDANLKEIVMPEKADTIDGYAIQSHAFENTPLTEINFPESLTSVGSQAFAGCANLTDVKLTDNITYLGTQAFKDCKRLASIDLNNITKIGYEVFSGVASLKEITIPKTLTSVDNAGQNHGALGESLIEKVIFEEGIPNIPAAICYEAYSLKEVVLPEKEDNIDGYVINAKAFSHTAISEIKLPDSLTEIKDNAFSGCERLTEVKFPESLKRVGTQAFSGCIRLSHADLANLESSGSSVFLSCYKLKKLIVPGTFQKVYTGSNSDGFLTGSSIETVIIEEGQEKVPDKFAPQSNSLRTVYLPDSVTAIGNYAFSSCPKLSRIYGSRNSYSFEKYSFSNCYSLDDPRFTVMDMSGTSISVNSQQNAMNDVVNFTLRYKVIDSLATANNPKATIKLNIPEGMTLLTDSVSSTDLTLDLGNIAKGYITTNKYEGEVRFAARLTEANVFTLTPELTFNTKSSGEWTQRIGSVSVECTGITLSAPESINAFEAEVYGLAAKGEPVIVYVNGKKSAELTASQYTGKYKGTVAVPEGEEGTEYTIQAVCGDKASDPVTVVYESNAPVVENVVLEYNKNKKLDITEVLTRGTSPVVSYLPAYGTHYRVKASNDDNIARMFITSRKNGRVDYMEAYYNKAEDVWVTNISPNENSFTSDSSKYIPGTLNISIIRKDGTTNSVYSDLDEYFDSGSGYDLAADGVFADKLNEKYSENSSVKVTFQIDHAVMADITVSDGTVSNNFLLYTDVANGVHIDGAFQSDDIDEAKAISLGFEKVEMPVADLGNKEYYARNIGKDDICQTLIDNCFINLFDYDWRGQVILEITKDADGDTYRLINQFVTEGARDSMETAFGSGFTAVGEGLDLGEKFLKFAPAIENSQDSGTYMASADVLFALKCLNTFGNTDEMSEGAGWNSPVPTVTKFSMYNALKYSGEYVDYEIENCEQFATPGYVRFIVDPSGVVYEAVVGNPVDEAEVTIYYRDSKTGEAVKWNAEEYDQINPIITEENGYYYWDVPEGQWKVICNKDGYESVESEWLDVPPVRTDIHLGLVSKEAPELVRADLTNDGIEVKLSKFVKIDTVTADTMKITGFEGDYAIAPKLLNAGDVYADTFVLTADFSEGAEGILITSDILSYADVAAVSGKVAVNDSRAKRGDVNGDGVVNVKDVTLIRRLMVGGWNIELDEELADVNGDGNINVKDITLIRRYLVGGWAVEL